MKALIQRVKSASVHLQSTDSSHPICDSSSDRRLDSHTDSSVCAVSDPDRREVVRKDEEACAYSKIGKGLCVFLGVEAGDDSRDLNYLVSKILKLRIFSDDDGKMNRSVRDVHGEILAVSQFTLCADTKKGNRPSFVRAENPTVADQMYEEFVRLLTEGGVEVRTGVFGADMLITIENDGPVTIWLDSADASERRRAAGQSGSDDKGREKGEGYER